MTYFQSRDHSRLFVHTRAPRDYCCKTPCLTFTNETRVLCEVRFTRMPNAARTFQPLKHRCVEWGLTIRSSLTIFSKAADEKQTHCKPKVRRLQQKRGTHLSVNSVQCSTINTELHYHADWLFIIKTIIITSAKELEGGYVLPGL